MSAATNGLPSSQGNVLEMFSLKGKVALVTGASRGIGAAIAIALAQAGAHLILAQRDIKNTSTADQIKSQGGKADIISCDLSDKADVEKTFDRAMKIASGIDILVNNGGMLKRTDSVDVTQDEWNYVLDVNLNSLFILSQHAGRHMIPRGKGKIINVASLNSYIGGMRVAHYTAAKGAVASLTKALSNEWSKHGICVNAIAPGSIATDINQEARKDDSWTQGRLAGIPGGRWGAPEDFMGPALFLASAASQYVTGETLVVDGGALAKGPI